MMPDLSRAYELKPWFSSLFKHSTMRLNMGFTLTCVGDSRAYLGREYEKQVKLSEE